MARRRRGGVITEWDEFRALDLARVKETLARPILVDLRNIYSIKTMKALGFRYAFDWGGDARRRDPIRPDCGPARGPAELAVPPLAFVTVCGVVLSSQPAPAARHYG